LPKIALAIARDGSLNGAARALGTAQPTVSRRLDGLARRIGAKLFERAASGLSPTALCIALVESLNHMEEGALAVERRIAGRDTGLQGPITVTSLAWFGDDVIAPLLARFSARHKLVTIDLMSDPRRFNLPRREADIAVRIGSFHQEYLVERKVADVSYGLYASADYLDRYGRPNFIKGCAGHLVTSLVESTDKVVHIEWLKAIAHPRCQRGIGVVGHEPGRSWIMEIKYSMITLHSGTNRSRASSRSTGKRAIGQTASNAVREAASAKSTIMGSNGT
jgi:DNA-binding transcriptional LysR family regulator